MTEADLIRRIRAGVPVTTIDKLRTIGSLAELQGFVDQVRADQRDLTKEEWELVARMKAQMEKEGPR